MFFDLHLARIIFTFAHTTRRDARTRRQYKKFFVRTAISPPFSRKTTPNCELSSAARDARVSPPKTIYIISATLCPKPLSASRKRRGNTRFVTPPFRRPTRRRATLPPASFLAQTSQNQSPPKRAFCLLCVLQELLAGVLDVGLRRRVDARRRATLPPASLLAQTSQNQSPPKRAFCLLCAEEYYFLGFLMLAPPPRKVRGGGQPCLPLHSSLKPHKIKARRSGLFVFCVPRNITSWGS